MDVVIPLPRHRRGVTLVELITTLAVIGISIAVVAPAWSSLSERSRITTAANSLLTDLRFARSTAVTRNRRIGVCPSSDGEHCSGDPAGWHDGYLVFVDADGDRRRSGDEALLRQRTALPSALRLTTTAGRPAVSFRPDGAAWSTNATFSVCLGVDPAAYRAVILYGSGRARVDRRAPANRPVRCG